MVRTARRTTARLLAAITTLIATASSAAALSLPTSTVVDSAVATVSPTSWSQDVVTIMTSPLDSSDAAGRYDDPYFLNWASFLPSYPGTTYQPVIYNECKKGQISCVDKVIRDMTKRYERLGCDHDAVFGFTYLHTTEAYRDYWYTGAFDDPAWMNHYDAVFGDFYFEAFDAWHRGDVANTPPAWRIAFHEGETKGVSGSGNVFLGMNAHIRRDLPFVIEAIGQTNADGTSRKADHDRVNEFLNAVNHEVLAIVAQRHDATADDGDVPFTSLDQSATIQLIVEWREEAWRKAEMLLNAPDEAERDRIARWIENEAAASAMALADLFSKDDSSARDAHCAAWLATR